MSRRGWVLFVAMALIWGTPYLLIKVAVEDLHPAVLVTLRCALAAALLLPVAAARGVLGSLRGRWGWVAVFSLVEIVGPFLLIAAAETRVTSSLAGLLIATVPLFAALGARATGLDAHIGPVRALGLLVGFAGVALLVGVDVRGSALLAALALVGAALGYAAGPLILTLRLARLPSLAVVAASQAVAAVVVAPWAALRAPDWAEVPARTWWAVVALGVVATAVALLVFFALVAEVGPARAPVITYLNPLVALALGVWLLDEPLTAGMLLGFPVVVAGSVLATRRSRERPPPDPEEVSTPSQGALTRLS